jgi:hypothetical protein
MNKLTDEHMKEIENCGVIFHNVGNFDLPLIQASLYIPINDYILKQQDYINRILFLDVFDSVFKQILFIKTFKKIYFILVQNSV